MTPDSTNPENGHFFNLISRIPAGCSDSTVSFALFRGVGSGSFTFLAKQAPGSTYRDYSIFRGQSYRYKTFGVNSQGVYGPASAIITFTAIDNELPSVPTGVTAAGW